MGCSQSKGTSEAVNTFSKADGLAPPSPKPPKPPKFETSAAASKALAQADASPPPSSPGACHAPFPPGSFGGPNSRSGTPTPSLDGSTHSGRSTHSGHSLSTSSRHSSKRNLKASASALGLDKMIDEKRDAKTMSERVVHIEVPFGKPIEEVYTGVHDGPVLGSGISGLVRLASHKATGLKYAVKCLDLGLVDTEEGLQQLREEIYIMCQLDHPNIVRLEEVYESHSEIYLVQELCLGGELFDRLDEQPDYHYTEAQCANLIKQMLCSVRYIHSKGIIHRDLKLENFLFSDTGPDSELKMIDFGLSKHFKFGEVQHEAVGTPYTVAPEVIRGSYDERCDVWAIGVITYLLLSGESPFGGCGGPESLMQVRDNILKCNFLFEPEDIWENVSDAAKAYIRRLLVTDPNLRPTAREVQKDPWIVDMTDDKKRKDDGALNPSVVRALVNFKEYSDMRKLLCEVLSFTLIPDQIQGLRKEFAKVDTDGSGEISLSALKTVLLGNAAQGSLGALSEEEVEDIFNAMRVSSTETTIHWHEFIAAGLSHCKVDERNLKLAFDRLDADHTGYITFENFMDLIGNGAGHSEEALRAMWGEASSNKGQYITYEDFLLLMKGQTKQSAPSPIMTSKIRPTTPLLDTLALDPVMEGKVEQSPGLGFMAKSAIDVSEEHSDGPICIDEEDGDNGVLNQGFAEAMQHQGGGFAIKGSLMQPKTPDISPSGERKSRAKSFDSDESKPPAAPVSSVFVKNSMRAVNLPEHERTDDKVNNLLNDKTKTPLVVNRELYRAHRTMRMAVLEASKRLEEEQQRRAREEIRKEQARSNKSAGLIMRHGGELSADAIKQFVVQQQKEEQRKVQEATKRAGRRRNRTSSDIRGMFGSSGKDLTNRTLPPKRDQPGSGGIPDFNALRRSGTQGHNASPLPIKALVNAPDLPDLPVMRNATKPGQFRKTNYDPFSYGFKTGPAGQEGGEVLIDSSLHRHLDMGVGFKKMKSTGASSKLKSGELN